MRSIVCGECFRAAFIADDGAIHHGTVDHIDHDLDSDHTAIDVEEIPYATDGPERMLMRWQAADDAFSSFDFGAFEVELAEGWEGATPGTDVSRVIQLACVQHSATQRARFVVRFCDFASAEVAEVFLTPVDASDNEPGGRH